MSPLRILFGAALYPVGAARYLRNPPPSSDVFRKLCRVAGHAVVIHQPTLHVLLLLVIRILVGKDFRTLEPQWRLFVLLQWISGIIKGFILSPKNNSWTFIVIFTKFGFV